MLPPFHGERMRAYEQVMREAAEREVGRWSVGSAFPLQPAMQAITLDVILRAVFGVSDRARREDLREQLVELLTLTRSPRMLGFAIRPLSGLYHRASDLVRRTDELLAEEIRERRADPDLGERGHPLPACRRS